MKFIELKGYGFARADAIICVYFCRLMEFRVIVELVSGRSIAIDCESASQARATAELIMLDATP